MRASIIMAVHNGARHLPAALASLTSQTFREWELVVVDDGSTDDTAQQLEQFARQDRRVALIRQEHRGLTVSLNRAIAAAGGAYLARHDADDLSHPQRLERQVRYLERQPRVAAVGTAGEVIGAEGEILAPLATRRRGAAIRRGLRSARVTPIHGSMMMRRDALAAVGGYREAFRFSQDVDLWLRILERFEMANLPERLYQWRLNPQGVYAAQRLMQLKYCGVALAFARERARFGQDSYDVLAASGGDVEAFAARYRLRGLLHGLWAELFVRARLAPATACEQIDQALRCGYWHPKSVFLYGWSRLGFAWPGRAPLGAARP